MRSTDTKGQFIELRAKGWSLARINAGVRGIRKLRLEPELVEAVPPPCHPKGETIGRLFILGPTVLGRQAGSIFALFLPRFCVIKRVGNQNWSKTSPVQGGSSFFDL